MPKRKSFYMLLFGPVMLLFAANVQARFVGQEEPGAVEADQSSVNSEAMMATLKQKLAEMKKEVPHAEAILADLSEGEESITVLSASDPAPPEMEGMVLETCEAAAATESKSDEDTASYGINLDFGFSSVYNFRGLNVFQSHSQNDQHAMFAPSLTWNLGDSGIWVNYWGAYQISGDNVTEVVHAGLGHEQDLVIGYDRELSDTLTLNASVTNYLYPYAKEVDAGTSVPYFVEPGVGLSFSDGIEFGVSVSYFHGVQNALADFSYVYFHQNIGRSIELNSSVGMDIGMGVGEKIFNNSSITDNTVDITFDWGLPVQVNKGFFVVPGIHAGWTNLKGVSFKDEFMVWGSVNIGVDF